MDDNISDIIKTRDNDNVDNEDVKISPTEKVVKNIVEISDDELKEHMNIDYSYPDVDDPYLTGKIYQKKEFYTHRLPARPDIKNYSDIKEFRDDICVRKFALLEHQTFLSNLISPDTPYKSLLIFHGTGVNACSCR